MVFIMKNRNFTSKTMFSSFNKLEMPFYSGKDGFYQEKQKFNLENEVFLSKRLLFIQNSPLKVENSVFIMRNRNLTSKTMFSREKL